MRWFRLRRRQVGAISRGLAIGGGVIGAIVVGGIIANNNQSNQAGGGTTTTTVAPTTTTTTSGVPTNPPAGTQLCSGGADAATTFASPYQSLPTLSTVNADPAFAGYNFTSVVNVPAGNNTALIGQNFLLSGNTFYWFAPGAHTLNGNSIRVDQPPESRVAFYGGGTASNMAVLDGQSNTNWAFTGTQEYITVKYLEVKNYIGGSDSTIVNHDAGNNWTVTNNILGPNPNGGALGLGNNQVVRSNCIFRNGQYAINGFSSNCAVEVPPGPGCVVSDILITQNEISENNYYTFTSGPATNQTVNGWATGALGAGCPNCGYDNYPTPGSHATCDDDYGQPYCYGFSGGMKLWINYGIVSNNWIHTNHAQGIWADTLNVITVTGNLIEDNWGIGLWYEVSYNADITGNTFRRNGWVHGSSDPSFPYGAIYMSESGHNTLVAPNPSGLAYTRIANNLFIDNWDGVVLWENPNRWCTNGSPTAECTNPQTGQSGNDGASLATCGSIGTATSAPLPTQGLLWSCRWATANVRVTNNTFNFTPANIDQTDQSPYVDTVSCTATVCGRNAVVSSSAENGAGDAHWPDDYIPHSITWDQGNTWDFNTYSGPWRFDTNEVNGDPPLTFTQWQTLTGSRNGTGVNTEDHPAFDVSSTCSGCP